MRVYAVSNCASRARRQERKERQVNFFLGTPGVLANLAHDVQLYSADKRGSRVGLRVSVSPWFIRLSNQEALCNFTASNSSGRRRPPRGGRRFAGLILRRGGTSTRCTTRRPPGEVDRAMRLAETAFEGYRRKTPQERARFLVAIGEEIDAVGDALVERAAAETGLPADPRLKGERARTVNQLKMFANLLEEGSWVDARIDRAMPDRKPLPRADIRRMLMPMGPVVAFAASNFPLAISVAGNDTASGPGRGVPVVVKAHPAHPGHERAGRRGDRAGGRAPPACRKASSRCFTAAGTRWDWPSSATRPRKPSASPARCAPGGRCTMRDRPGRSRSPFTRRWGASTRCSSCPARWPSAGRRSRRGSRHPSRSASGSSAPARGWCWGWNPSRCGSSPTRPQA